VELDDQLRYGSDEESTRLTNLVRAIWRSTRGRLPSDLLAGCLQEARICIWEVRGHLETLPEPDRPRYLARCITHRVLDFLRRQHRQQIASVSIEELQTGEGEVKVRPSNWQRIPLLEFNQTTSECPTH
jgi:DNA-directed RNA polymerase specialized sigma24 family protein